MSEPGQSLWSTEGDPNLLLGPDLYLLPVLVLPLLSCYANAALGDGDLGTHGLSLSAGILLPVLGCSWPINSKATGSLQPGGPGLTEHPTLMSYLHALASKERTYPSLPCCLTCSPGAAPTLRCHFSKDMSSAKSSWSRRRQRKQRHWNTMRQRGSMNRAQMAAMT